MFAEQELRNTGLQAQLEKQLKTLESLQATQGGKLLFFSEDKLYKHIS